MDKGMAVATPEEIEDILNLESFKKQNKYPSNNYNGGKIYYFETAWRRKPKSIKSEKYENIEIIDLRWKR
jgi:hypothetical protein